MTPECIDKLKEAFSADASDEEACAWAGIHTATFYDYLNKYPDFAEQRTALKKLPRLHAKWTVNKEAKTNLAAAQWLLERRAAAEYGKKVISQIEGQLDVMHGTTPGVSKLFAALFGAPDNPEPEPEGEADAN